MSTYKRFKANQHGDVAEARLLDQQLSDLVIQSELADEFLQFALSDHPNKVVVNFSNVQYCASAAISALINFRNELKSSGGVVKICGVSQPIREAFQSLNLDGTLFEIHDSLDEAVGSFE